MMTRRLLFASPFVIRATSAMAADVEVAIIGAGAAGLAAAQRLKKKGVNFRLIEARSRLGGRCTTDLSLGSPVDLGAAYIHFAAKNPWEGYAQENNVKTTPFSFNFGRTKQFLNGKELGENELREGFRVGATVREAIDEHWGFDTSLAALAYKANGQAGIESIRRTGHLGLGEEPENVSVNDYNTLWGGDNRLVLGGYGALMARHYADLPIYYDTQVLEIREGRPAKIHTTKGDFTATKVIFTLPIGVLQSDAIKLPASSRFQKALEGFKMGALSKVIFALEGETLRERAGERVIDTHEKAVIAFDIRPYESNLVLAGFGGDFARQIAQMPAQEAFDYFQNRLNLCFGEKVKIKQQLKSDWVTNPFSKGSYAVVTPKNIASRQLIREPMRDNIFYCGEATALEASMTVGGATLEGLRVADKIIASRGL